MDIICTVSHCHVLSFLYVGTNSIKTCISAVGFMSLNHHFAITKRVEMAFSEPTASCTDENFSVSTCTGRHSWRERTLAPGRTPFCLRRAPLFIQAGCLEPIVKGNLLPLSDQKATTVSALPALLILTTVLLCGLRLRLTLLGVVVDRTMGGGPGMARTALEGRHWRHPRSLLAGRMATCLPNSDRWRQDYDERATGMTMRNDSQLGEHDGGKDGQKIRGSRSANDNGLFHPGRLAELEVEQFFSHYIHSLVDKSTPYDSLRCSPR